MEEPWYDTCRKHFDARDEAIASLDTAVKVMKEVAGAMLRKRLAQGFSLVGDVVIDHISVIEVIENRHELLYRKGTAYIEVRTVATLQKAAA